MKRCLKMNFFGVLLFTAGFRSVNAQQIVPEPITSYVSFVDQQKLSAKDYVISLFDQYDIVIFYERIHDELTQYELLTDLFADSRFYNKVGNIFMEIGGSNYNNEINKYLLAENLSPDQSNQKALEIQRKSSWYPLWDRYNYHYLLTSLYKTNKSLPTDKKIMLHPTDIAIDWK